MTRRLIPLLILVLGALAPASAQAYLPHGFIGISPQNSGRASDFELMRKAGIESVRIPLNWISIEPNGPSPLAGNWGFFDHEVELAAEAGLRIMPFVSASPEWVAPESKDLPVSTVWQRRAWVTFLRTLVERYGPEGSFWELHPELPFRPFHRWEIWNEENLVTFAKEPDPAKFATLIRISGRALHSADPESKVILGGLFGQPLQIPPNLGSGNFLARVYKAGNVKPYFDGVGLHPYVGEAAAMGRQLTNLRRIMRAHGDPNTPLYVTELGWGSQDGPTRWQRGIWGQAESLDEAFELLSRNRGRWKVDGAWWFSWSDEGGTCIFCTTAGLLTQSREAKPSWYRFNEWTGGNPDTVPRLRLGE